MTALGEHREHIFAVAYRMLGSVSDAEDIVQDTCIRWLRREKRDDVRSVRGFLTTTATRLCIDRLRQLKRQRESYEGTWLPEPIATVGDRPPQDPLLTESLSMAFLVVLETLAPHERAAFLLRDIFELDYSDIAEAIDKSVANCRQICKRARQRVAAEPRFVADRASADELAMRFFSAISAGDVDAIVSMLREDIVAWSDHGGKAAAARNSIEGASNVARYLIGAATKFAGDKHPVFADINGSPGVILYDGTAVHAVLVVIAAADRIARFAVIRNPDKLALIPARQS